jgi:sodium transport system permease protein
MFGALCLALAAFARSTKEGQYYLVPLLFVTLPLAVLPAASGMELNLGNSLIPITGMVLLLRAALQGSVWEALEFLPTVTLVTLGCCLLSIRWAVEQFNSESVLFREGERWDLGLWLRHLLQDRKPTPTAAGAVFCGVVILFVFFYANLNAPEVSDFAGFARSTLVLQLAVIATPALLMTIMLTTSPRQTLLLRWPTWPAVVGAGWPWRAAAGLLPLLAAAFLAVVAHPVIQLVNKMVLELYPMHSDVVEAMTQISKILEEAELWPVLLIFAALPAVCEELAFRGFILSGFRKPGHKWRAIIFSALFFGFVHGMLQRTLVSGLLGVVIGFLAIQTGSILPGMVFHVLHNSLLLALPRFSGAEEIASFWPVIAVSACATAAVLYWFHRLPCRQTPDLSLRERPPRHRNTGFTAEARRKREDAGGRMREGG